MAATFCLQLSLVEQSMTTWMETCRLLSFAMSFKLSFFFAFLPGAPSSASVAGGVAIGN